MASPAVTIERVPGHDGYADSLIVRTQAAGDGPGILVLCHLDTVHDLGTRATTLPPGVTIAVHP